MSNKKKIVEHLIESLSSMTSTDVKVDGTTALIGAKSAIKSIILVEFLLDVEEFMEDEFDVEFDWTSENAMSQSKSLYRSLDALADHLAQITE